MKAPATNAQATKTAAGVALKSMTGYAQARLERGGWLFRVNVRSVNHRFLDLRVRVPEGFEAFEPQVRQQVRDRLRRGHVEVTLHLEAVQGPAARVNRDVAGAYLTAIEQLRREFTVASETDLLALLRLPGVVTAAGVFSSVLAEEDLERLGEDVKECVASALERLEEMRLAEGRALYEEMHRLVAGIERLTFAVVELAERSRPVYAQRLKSRIEELLGGAPLDAARIAQEAALLAERADISE
jgi:uncharacterized protein (TIGR00255 family)